MKKKYIIFFIISAFILLFSFELFRKKSDTIDYKIDGYHVIEKVVDDQKYLHIEQNEKKYYYLHDDKNKEKSVKKIYPYYDGIYSCIFIEFVNGTSTNDLLCYKDGINYRLSSISNPSSLLKTKYDNLVNDGKIKLEVDDTYKFKESGLFKFYTNNLDENLTFALTSYKGLYVLSNNEIDKIELFNKDVYEQNIKIFIGEKYLVADYNQKYEFNDFYVVNLKSRKIETIKSKYDISFDSSIVGFDNNIVYLFDNSNGKSYIVDLKKNKITLSSNKKTDDFNYIDDYKIIHSTDNNYYLLKDNILYKSNLKSSSSVIYLFSIDNKNKIKISDDYICFLEGNYIKYYDNFGYKSLVFSEEFSFNKNLDFTIIKNR